LIASQVSNNNSMSSKPSSAVLPRYADLESESAPLLSGIDAKGDYEDISGQCEEFVEPASPQRRCFRFGLCKRWRKEPKCENRRCLRRRKIARFFLFIIAALLFFHLVKFVYTLYTLPRHIHCDTITDPTTTIELPLKKKIFLHHSLSTADLSVVREENTAEGSFKIQVEFDSIDDSDESAICHGTFKKALIFGALAKDKGGSLPSIKRTTLVLPVSAPTPFIGFGLGGHKGKGHCIEKMIRRFVNLKNKKQEEEDE